MPRGTEGCGIEEVKAGTEALGATAASASLLNFSDILRAVLRVFILIFDMILSLIISTASTDAPPPRLRTGGNPSLEPEFALIASSAILIGLRFLAVALSSALMNNNRQKRYYRLCVSIIEHGGRNGPCEKI